MASDHLSYAPNYPRLAETSADARRDAAVVDRWVGAFVLLGVAARLVRYLLCFPLWDDECFVCANLIDRSFTELIAPLDYHQVAPPLYLWCQKLLVTTLGFNEWSLRLCSLTSAVASLILFRYVAQRLVGGAALILSVGCLAVAYPLIRYSAEAKPYASDLAVSLLMTSLAVAWWQRPDRIRWLLCLAAVAPLAVGFSYPAAFVGGGLSLFVAVVLWNASTARGWVAWLAYNVALVGGFVGWQSLVASAQFGTGQDFMTEWWKNAFPPLGNPFSFFFWLIETHASDGFCIPHGGSNWESTPTLLFWLTSLMILVRQKGWPLLWLCLPPLALNLLAAAMHRYPYGGHIKLMLYAAGTTSLLAGFGLAALIDRLGQSIVARRRAVLVAIVVFSLAAVGSMARDVWGPYKSKSDVRARDFARWFWYSAEFDAEVACVNRDLKQSFWQQSPQTLNCSAMYFCNMQIYAPHRVRRRAIDFDRVTAEHPLRCVLYHTPLNPQDDTAVNHWLAEMLVQYDLAGHDWIAAPRYDKERRESYDIDHLELFKFVPKRSAAEMPAGGERLASPIDEAARLRR